jgi:hypothetical protein
MNHVGNSIFSNKHIFKIPNTRAGGVVQSVSLEFNPSTAKKKKNLESTN